MKKKVFLQALGLTLVITFAISYLFFNSLWAGLLGGPLFPILWKRLVNQAEKRERDALRDQFLDFMQVVSASLLAGLSMENSWREAEEELITLHGKKAQMCRELNRMNRAIQLNEPLEGQLMAFAKRSQLEEIESFAEVFSYAKRSGGDFIGIIGTTVGHLRLKRETMKEIELQLTSRKFEQKIMNILPLIILAYLRLTSGDYLDVLYTNLVGRLVMGVALLLYGLSILLSEKIMDIEI